ncbi:MAG: C4-dicarboxylate ABC transporter permease [Chloroflexi bacterium RBG_16_50_9]|nr:MAG: C4-dicarboxylate ABC transporter permease [Chloroflexi bacterium RBG_16_50_9]
MTPLEVGAIGVGVLLVLLFSRMPIGLVMGLVGFAGFAYLAGLEGGLGVLRTVVYSTFASYDLSVIPLFILMGSFCFYAGLSKDLYDMVHSWLGRLRGGLAMATVGACAAFAAISGSSLATAATMGTVALPEMKRYKYDDRLATGAVAAGGTIGILIPPSIILILYGIITEQSIGKLFLAGFIPGVLEAVFYIATIYILCRSNPKIAPPGPVTTFIQKLASLKNTWIVLVLFVLVIGGIYAGIFSPTEAAGVGAFGAFVFGLARRRLGWKAFKDSLADTGKTTAMIFLIILGAMILGYFLAISRIPFVLADYIGALPMNRYIILILVLLLYLILGCVMDSMAIMLLITPIFFPLILSLGFDPIWFGILITRMSEIGLITPPVGLNVYVIQGVAKDVPMQTIFQGIIPFLVADICEVALLISVPQLSLFLPGLMK